MTAFALPINTRYWNRKTHHWGAMLIALPFLIVLATGILLQVKKEVAWVQPPTQRGQAQEPAISLDALLAAAMQPAAAGIRGWADIDRIDIQPGRGIAKVVAHNRWEVQIDTHSAQVLQVAYRRSDLIEQIHDGSWFHERAKLWVFLPVAIVVLVLWGTGVYMIFLPYLARRWRHQRTAAASRDP